MFVFPYAGEFHGCISLRFSWGRLCRWFVKLLRPVVKYIWKVLGYRVLTFIDDFFSGTFPT